MNSDTNLHRKPTFLRRRKSEDFASDNSDPTKEILVDKESAFATRIQGLSALKEKKINKSCEYLGSRNASTVYH